MTERKFYRTVYEVEVLSEEPLSSNLDLDQIHYLITDGDCSGLVSDVSSEEIDGKKCAELLMEQGSDPSFFQLTEDGEDDEDALS